MWISGRSAVCDHTCCAGVVVARRRSLRHLRAARCRGSLGSSRPHLCRDWARPAHICTGTGPTPAHICTGTGLAPLPHPSQPGGRAPPGDGGPFGLGRAGAIGRSAGRTGPEWCAPLRRAHGYSREIQEVWKRYSRGNHAVRTRYSRGTHAVLTRCSRGAHAVNDTLRRVRERTLPKRRTWLYTTRGPIEANVQRVVPPL
jgi:hypothetical protein